MKKQLIFSALLSTALLGSGSAWAETADDVDCNGCIRGNEIAKQTITQKNIAKDSIGEKKIKDRAVTADKLSDEVYDAIGELQTQMADLQQKNSDLQQKNADLQGDLDENRSALEGLCDDIAYPFPNFCPYNVAFVTSATYTGDLGGLAGADQKCTDAANAAGLPGTYMAFLVPAYEEWMGGVSYIDRAKLAPPSAPPRITNTGYRRVDGAIIARSRGAITAEFPYIENPIVVNEYGEINGLGFLDLIVESNEYQDCTLDCALMSHGQVWLKGCEGFTTASSGYFSGTVGYSASRVRSWFLEGYGVDCSETAHLYCFQD